MGRAGRPTGVARRKVLSEETTWSAHPEPAPAGTRVLYSSYRGRQWHQLWLTTPDGAAPLPLTFGDFDARNARWSPDGTRVAYISNEHGNTALVVQDLVGGHAAGRRGARASLRDAAGDGSRLDIVDAAGQRTPARVAVVAQRRARLRARATPGCTATTASTARASRWRRITSIASRLARSTMPPGRGDACGSSTDSRHSPWRSTGAARGRA